MNYKNTYKLLVMGGLAPIKLEVCADSLLLTDKGVYCFKLKNVEVAYYPIATTIIQNIEENTDYVAEVYDGRLDANGNRMDANLILEMMRRNRFDG